MERHRQIIGCSRDRSRETNFNVESGRQTEGNNCMTRTNSSQDSRTTRFNIDHADRVSFPVFPFYRHPRALLSPPLPFPLFQPPSSRTSFSSKSNLGVDSVIVVHAVTALCNRIVNEERRGRNRGVGWPWRVLY